METLDLKREWKALYTARRTPALVDVPARHALVVDGEGAPASEAFAQAIGALYGVAYTLKFTLKRAGIADYPVLALETLWDFGAGGGAPRPGEPWTWTAFIDVPDVVTAPLVREAARTAAAKRPSPALERVRLRTIREGRAAQVMHVGPYDAEAATIAQLVAFIAAEGCVIPGRHHEVYLSDPRRAAPERLKTIIRYPVKRASRTAAAAKR